jgi:hypothetical protein
MQVNSINSNYNVNFGVLSPMLKENMWQAVKRNCPKSYLSKAIEKSKLYQDYKYILENTNENDHFYFEVRSNYDKGFIVDKVPYPTMRYDLNHIWDISKAYRKKDPYKEMIKIFAQKLRNNDTDDSLSNICYVLGKENEPWV